jgi:tRNA 2-thiocytidine biosynthesis protein TtcA
MGKAIADFDLIEQDDRVMVCISGGKDSHVMLELLIALRESAPIDFEIVAVTLDQKQPDYPEEVLPGRIWRRWVFLFIFLSAIPTAL